MRSYHAESGGGLASLMVREHELPEPGPGEVLVAVRATSLSFREWMVLRGNYVLGVKPDVVPVSDGAGDVIAVGSGVSGVEVGDRVAATLFPLWLDGPFGIDVIPQIGGSLDGMLTEFAVRSADGLVTIPEHLSYEQAATLPCAAVTAWNAVTGGRRLLPGETVLTLGSGGVSLFALQFAKLMGARVIATTGSPDKEQRLRDLGADEVVNYRTTPDWEMAARELTGGAGADLVVHTAGAVQSSLTCVAVAGQVAYVGSMSDGGTAPIDPGVLFASGASVRAVAVGSRAQFVAMNRAIAVNRLAPVIDRVFAFDDAPAAYEYYATGRAFGKVVLHHG
jgi:NADPH:quinone reductase-like Zn-dependent oxidoreductase